MLIKLTVQHLPPIRQTLSFAQPDDVVEFDEIWSFNPKTKQWKPVRLPTTALPRRKLSRMAVQGKRVALVVDE